MALRAAIYTRVSTSLQDQAMQLRDLREYAERRGFKIAAEYEDVLSESKNSRPGLDGLMSDAKKKKFDAVLVWRFDRYARSTSMLVSSLTEFRRLGIDFISYSENIDTSSPLGEAIFTIIAAMGQLERDVIRERVRGGLRNARARGKQLGRPKRRNDERIRILRKRGLSIRAIAKSEKVSTTAVQRALRAVTKT